MPTITEIIGIVWDLILENWAVVIIVIAFVAVLTKKIVDNRRLNKQANNLAAVQAKDGLKEMMQKGGVPPAPEIPTESETQNLKAMFDEKAVPTTKENLIDSLNKTTQRMKAENKELEKSIGTTVKEVREVMIDIAAKKNQIKRFGLDLATLYDKYSNREKQLAMMLVQMEQMAKIEENPQSKS